MKKSSCRQRGKLLRLMQLTSVQGAARRQVEQFGMEAWAVHPSREQHKRNKRVCNCNEASGGLNDTLHAHAISRRNQRTCSIGLQKYQVATMYVTFYRLRAARVVRVTRLVVRAAVVTTKVAAAVAMEAAASTSNAAVARYCSSTAKRSSEARWKINGCRTSGA